MCIFNRNTIMCHFNLCTYFQVIQTLKKKKNKSENRYIPFSYKRTTTFPFLTYSRLAEKRYILPFGMFLLLWLNNSNLSI